MNLGAEFSSGLLLQVPEQLHEQKEIPYGAAQLGLICTFVEPVLSQAF